MRQTGVLAGLVGLPLLAAACSSDSAPSTPTAPPTTTMPAPPAARATIAVTSINVAADRGSTGYVYRVVVRVKESGGVAATISGVELVFTSNATTVKIERF